MRVTGTFVEFEDPLGDVLEEITVVGYADYSAFELIEELDKAGGGGVRRMLDGTLLSVFLFFFTTILFDLTFSNQLTLSASK